MVAILGFYEPSTGFTSLISFGDEFQSGRLDALTSLPVRTMRASSGYDGQFYAQLAVAGNPFAPGLPQALDSPAYRSRRILLPIATHVLALGRPWWILQLYALSNLICWVVLAALLARWWFPPTGFHNLLRWAGVLFGAGMVVSVTKSLTDGPALLVVCLGVRAYERDRRWIAAALIGLAGLVRETSVLAASMFLSGRSEDQRRWSVRAARILLATAPLIVWAAVLHWHYRHGGGSRNLSLPIVALITKLRELYRRGVEHGFRTVIDEAAVVGAFAVQAIFLVARPQPRVVWWRMGAAFVLLGLCLGDAVWQGAPSAALRALLPMTLAFNVLAPRAPAGLALLVAGNMSVVSVPWLLNQVPSNTMRLAHDVRIESRDGWYEREFVGRHIWRWTTSGADLTIVNGASAPRRVTLTFGARSPDARTVTFETAGTTQTVGLPANAIVPVQIGPLLASPGETIVHFTSSTPPWHEPSAAGGRDLVVSIYDLSAQSAP